MSAEGYKKRYGTWAGNPRGFAPNMTRCCEEVGDRSTRITMFHQCTNPRGHGPGGMYCKIHDPDRVKTRRAAADAKYSEKYNRELPKFYGHDFLKALQKIADGANDARAVAREAIAEFEKGKRK